MEKESPKKIPSTKLILVGELEEWEGVFYGILENHREVVLKTETEEENLDYLGTCHNGNLWYSLGQELKEHLKGRLKLLEPIQIVYLD